VPEPINAFKYPDNPDAIFPQKIPPPIIDLRTSHNVDAVLEYTRTKRKRTKGVIHSKSTAVLEKELEDKINRKLHILNI